MAALPRQQQGLGCCPRPGSRPLLAARPLPARRRCLQAVHATQPRPLLLDNYDSYTYNLYQIIAEAYGGVWVWWTQLLSVWSSSCMQCFLEATATLSACYHSNQTPDGCRVLLAHLQSILWCCTTTRLTLQPSSRCWQQATSTTSSCHQGQAHHTTRRT